MVNTLSTSPLGHLGLLSRLLRTLTLVGKGRFEKLTEMLALARFRRRAGSAEVRLLGHSILSIYGRMTFATRQILA